MDEIEKRQLCMDWMKLEEDVERSNNHQDCIVLVKSDEGEGESSSDGEEPIDWFKVEVDDEPCSDDYPDPMNHVLDAEEQEPPTMDDDEDGSSSDCKPDSIDVVEIVIGEVHPECSPPVKEEDVEIPPIRDCQGLVNLVQRKEESNERPQDLTQLVKCKDQEPSHARDCQSDERSDDSSRALQGPLKVSLTMGNACFKMLGIDLSQNKVFTATVI
ncbi:uncharacterized protein [Ambystoma mexicanum]|uniref:uncharacterized protein n=1 Tax=Ambystoma mexicanum TaxID=8296 RepID=UPI0037E83C22